MTTDFTRQIAWEKWVDPYGSDLDQAEWPGAFGDFETDKMLDGDYEDDDEDDGEFYSEDKFEEVGLQPKPSISQHHRPTKVLATPAGLVPITEWSSPSRVYNFYIIHSNFRMTDSIQNILDNTDGIETLDVFSPYRWRIAIGKAFDVNTVKQRVLQNLDAVPLQLPGETK